MLKIAVTTRAIYKSSFLVNIIPNEPIYKAISLSSIEAKPKYELSLTSFRHLAHLWIAVLVSETSRGINISARKPKISNESIVKR